MALQQCSDHLCGCDITEQLDLPKNLLSYHISKLTEHGIVTATKCGRRKQYIIAPDKRKFVAELIELVSKPI